jgi:uncharacterized protein (UPF0548 family)
MRGFDSRPALQLLHTGCVFSLRKLSEDAIQEQIIIARGSPSKSPWLLTITDGLLDDDLGPFVYDRSRTCLGSGKSVFNAAKRAFANWQMFDLGWVRVVNTAAPIECRQIIAVEVRALGFWSVNLSQILETVDSETQFGFLYSTTLRHIEQGEETFLLRFDPATGEVSYELEAVSRPRHFLARLEYPITRSFQHKFARDSHRRMSQADTLKA